MTTADDIALFGVCISLIGLLFGGVSLRYVIRTDRRETAAAEAERLREAEERGRKQALTDARLQQLEDRTRHEEEDHDDR